MTEPHKHCPACGTPIPMSERVCSPRCEQVVAENQKKIKRTRNMLYGLFAVFILVWLYFSLKGKLF
jgi:predicted nucleic acid-binding Zn ribbon protein